MSQLHCYLNGQFCPIESASLPISDLGFIHGVTVTEQLRTLNRKPFLISKHLQRFENGLRLLEITLNESLSKIESIVESSASRFLDDCEIEECGIGLFATPGSTARFGQAPSGPSFCVYCYPLPSAELSAIYESGFRLKISNYRDVGRQCWPKDVKVRSRLHYYLADLEARKSNRAAILTDPAGFFRDTSTAAPIFIFTENQMAIPPEEDILNSVSLDYAIRLAEELDIRVQRRPIHVSELSHLKGMALANSLFCLAKVAEIENRKTHPNSPEIDAMVGAWKEKTGVDFENC